MLDKETVFKKRNRPKQKRAQETFDQILQTAALLLEEVGFDKLSTNMICERTAITPPALYRYFPNKYSILKELGERLMDAQNEALLRWLSQHEADKITSDDLAQMLLEQYEITIAQPGAKWIMLSLRSAPVLAKVRLESHAYIIDQLTKWQLASMPDMDPNLIRRRQQITNEAGYAMLEMLIDNDTADMEGTLRDTAAMFLALARFDT